MMAAPMSSSDVAQSASQAVAELRGAVAALLVADTAEQRRAQAWLEEFRRKQAFAWATATAALAQGSGGDASHELCIFSAQTLALLARRRPRTAEADLPEEERRVLHWPARLQNVLALMAAWAPRPHARVVLAQLSLAAAALLVRCAAQDAPLGEALATALQMLCQRVDAAGVAAGSPAAVFSGLTQQDGNFGAAQHVGGGMAGVAVDTAQRRACLALLGALPEEATRAYQKLPPHRRDESGRLLQTQCGPSAARALVDIAQRAAGDEALVAESLDALRSWVEQDALDLTDAMKGLAIAFQQLRRLCEQSGQVDEAQLRESRLWCSAVQLLHSAMDTYTGMDTTALFMQELLNLDTLAPLVPDICTLFVSCCVVALPGLAEPGFGTLWQRMLNVVLDCSRSRQLAVAGVTLDLWTLLPDYVQPSLADGMEALLQAAVGALLGSCAFPHDYAQRTLDWQQQHEEHRDNARAALRGFVRCCPALRMWLVTTAADHLEATALAAGHAPTPPAAAAAAAKDIASAMPLGKDAALGIDWQTAEAVLHVVSAVAKPLFTMLQTSDEPAALQNALERVAATFPALPGHPALQRSLALLLGGIWGWLGQRPALAETAFVILVRNLALPEDDELYPMCLTENHAACVGLLKLSRVPQSAAAFHLLGEAYSTQLQLQAPTVSHTSLRLLVQALCQCIEHTHSVEEASQGLTTLLSMIVPRVAQLTPVAGHVRGAVAPLVCALEEWATVARCFRRRDAPTLLGEAMCQQLGADDSCFVAVLLNTSGGRTPAAAIDEVMEACRELSLALLTRAAEHVPMLTLMLVQVFWHHFLHVRQAPACLEILRCGLELHGGSDEGVYNFFASTLPALIDALGSDLTQGQNPAFKLCEDMFNLLSAACTTLPTVVWPQSIALLSLIVHTLNPLCKPLLQKGGPAKALLGLVVSLCQRRPAQGSEGSKLQGRAGAEASAGASPALSDSAVEAQPSIFVHLVMGLLYCVCDLMPSYMLEDVVYALRCLLATYGTETVCAWLGEAINLPNFPRSGTRPAAKQQFLDDVARSAEQRQWPRLKSAVKTFSGGKKKGTSGTPAKGTTLAAAAMAADAMATEPRTLSAPTAMSTFASSPLIGGSALLQPRSVGVSPVPTGFGRTRQSFTSGAEGDPASFRHQRDGQEGSAAARQLPLPLEGVSRRF